MFAIEFDWKIAKPVMIHCHLPRSVPILLKNRQSPVLSEVSISKIVFQNIFKFF